MERLFVFVLTLATVSSLAVAQGDISRARLEVKRFINDHLPSYPDVDIKYIGGADPEMVLLDADSNEVQRVAVATFSEEEIMELLESHGIVKRSVEEDNSEREHEDL